MKSRKDKERLAEERQAERNLTAPGIPGFDMMPPGTSFLRAYQGATSPMSPRSLYSGC